jgi:hypothetical protein
LEAQKVSEIKIVRFKMPQAAQEKAAYIVPWKLVLSALFARISGDKDSEVSRMSAVLSESYGPILSADDAAGLNNFDSLVLDVPMVPITEDRVKKQITEYEETVADI